MIPIGYGVKTYKEGGKGKKQCTECNLFVAARSSRCACGHDFSAPPPRLQQPTTKGKSSSSILSPKKKSNEEVAPITHTTICIPCGVCPVKLEASDKESVEEWARAVRLKFRNDRKFLSKEGLRYFTRQFFRYDSDEQIEACRHVTDMRNN